MGMCNCCQEIYTRERDGIYIIKIRKVGIFICQYCIDIALSTASPEAKRFITRCKIYQDYIQRIQYKIRMLYEDIQQNGIEDVDLNEFKTDVINIELDAKEFLDYINLHKKEVEAELMLIGFKKELIKSTFRFSSRELIDVFGIKIGYINKYRKANGFTSRDRYFNTSDINAMIKLQK